MEEEEVGGEPACSVDVAAFNIRKEGDDEAKKGSFMERGSSSSMTKSHITQTCAHNDITLMLPTKLQ